MSDKLQQQMGKIGLKPCQMFTFVVSTVDTWKLLSQMTNTSLQHVMLHFEWI